jgi:hypothetical protein
MLDKILPHLEALVSFDTRNPPRDIGTGGIFDYLRGTVCPGFAVEVTDHGAGAVSMLAVRGAPTRLFNVHLDTVPSSPHWSADPHSLRVAGSRHRPGVPAISRARPRACSRPPHNAERRCRVPVQHRRGSQRCALHRRVSCARSRLPKRSSPNRRAAKRCSRIAASLGADAIFRAGGPCLGRERDAQRAAPGDALGRARWSWSKRGARALRWLDRPALQHRSQSKAASRPT